MVDEARLVALTQYGAVAPFIDTPRPDGLSEHWLDDDKTRLR